MKDKLTVEIFQDAITSPVSIDPIYTSLNGLAKIRDIFAIVDDRHELLHDPEDPEVMCRQLMTERSGQPADLNIMITRQRVSAKPHLAGVSYVAPNHTVLGVRMAIIQHTSHDKVTKKVADHEIAHMINVKTAGKHYDGIAHCTSKDCLMSAEAPMPRGKLAEVLRLSLQQLSIIKDQGRELYKREYCQDCIEQIAPRTDELLQAKQGIKLPRYVLFPIYHSPTAADYY